MPPVVALVLCYAFIAWLLRGDLRWRDGGSKALWIPAVWVGIIGSRPVSYWVSGGGGGADAAGEGNPVNTLVFGLLIACAIIVLNRRRIDWGRVVGGNKAVFLIYLFFALSPLWSDLPFVSFKRLVKDFGGVVVALVLLTEVRPAEAARAVFVRVAWVLFPLSVVFGKYFPHIGRGFSVGGEPMFTGITTQKNSLGQMVFVLSLVILWDLVEIRRRRAGAADRRQEWIRIGMLGMGLYLLHACQSKTSLLCLVVGCVAFWAAGVLPRLRNGRGMLAAGLAGIVCLAALDEPLGLSDAVVRSLGRDPTLTGRTAIWETLLAQDTDPVLGEGFYVFWDSPAGRAVIQQLRTLNSAHNGYLEAYLDGGMVGVGLLVLMLASGLARVFRGVFDDRGLGRIGLVFWLLAVVYNISESNYFRLGILWFTLLLVILRVPWREQQEEEAEPGVGEAAQEGRVPGGAGPGPGWPVDSACSRWCPS